jgi:hypothetical protein
VKKEVRRLLNEKLDRTKRRANGALDRLGNSRQAPLISGSGDYVVNSRNISNSGQPRPRNSASFSVLERTEFVGDIITSHTAGNTRIQKFRVNPGNAVLFPWASKVATQFESYIPIQCVFEYRTTSVDALNSTNTALGKVVLAAQYNTYARDWDTLVEIENSNSAVSVKPSKGARCGIECKANLRGAQALFVSDVGGTDSGRPFYDVADFYIATSGMQGQDVKVGALYVTYKFKVFNPIVNDKNFPTLEYCISDSNIGSTTLAFTTAPTVQTDSFTPYYGDGFTATNTTSTLTLAFPPLLGDTMMVVNRLRTGTSTTRAGGLLPAAPTTLPASSAAYSTDFDGFSVAFTGSATQTNTFSNSRHLLQAGTTSIEISPSAGSAEAGASADAAYTSIVFIPWEKNQ